MSRTYYHRHRRKDWKAPRWFINKLLVRPERREIREILKTVVREGIEADPEVYPDSRANCPHWWWS